MEVKDLLAQEESVMVHNSELTQKLTDEQQKLDSLLDEKLDIEEQLKRLEEEFAKVQDKIAE